MSTVHVVGGGLAGLAAAVTLARTGRRVTLWEAGHGPGGRCRSWADPVVGGVIDNGTHLALSGNRALRRYLTMIGAADRMVELAPAALPFIDLADGAGWTLRPGLALLARAAARPPGVSALNLLGDVARLLTAPPSATVAQVLGGAAAFDRLWRPLTVSALNMAPETAAAALLAAVCRETLLRGEAACRPLLPRVSLDHALIAPAVAALRRAGGEIRLSARLRGLAWRNGRVAALDGPDVTLGTDDVVILAVPAWIAAGLLPDTPTPPPGPAIVNAHFQHHAAAPPLPLLGLCGGRCDWLFHRPGALSVTISAADDLADRPANETAALAWREIRRAGAGADDGAAPPCRVVKERRATFAATPAAQSLRPPTRSRWSNLLLAGDWVANGLPSTMEGAIRSGFAAAAAALRRQKPPKSPE